MRYVRFNFIDENFGDKVDCVLVWDDKSFIFISNTQNKTIVKEYEEITELFKDLAITKNELDFFRNLTVEQEKEINELLREMKKMEYK